jgi:hypothetical protein
VAVQEAIQPRRWTSTVSGKSSSAGPYRCGRDPSTTESGHAALDRSLSFSSLLLVTSASTDPSACAYPP